MHRIVLLLLIVGFSIPAYGQQDSLPDAEFGSIPDSLFSMQPPADAEDTPYVIANKELDVSFQEADDSIIAVLEHHFRLKIFDADKREASIIAIPYYFLDDMERITTVEAYTYLPSGERVALSEQDIRTVNVNSRYNVKEFAMPAVEDGAIIEYRYTIERQYIEELPDFYLSHEVPTANAKVAITYPKYLRYDAYTENFDQPVHNDFVYQDTSSVPKVFTIPQPAPIITERWIARDIPPVKEEAYISSLDDYRGKIKFLMSEFGIPRQELENNWQVVVARIRDKTDPWEQINANQKARAVGDSIGKALDETPKEEVQDSIYHFLNERVNFSETHSSFSETSAEQVLNGESSDQAAINQTLVAMLRGADIEANPVLISTRQAGKINADFPSFYQFNSMIVQSEIDEEAYLMDAGFPYSQPDLIPVETYGNRGLVLSQDTFDWIDIHPDKSIFDISVDVDAELDEDGTLRGKIEGTQDGYPAQMARQQRADGSRERDILLQAFFDGYSQINIENVTVKNLEGAGKPITFSARFEIDDYATSFSDGLQFRPMIVGYRDENPFSGFDRNLPITLDAPENLDLSYSIKLPQGYTINEDDDKKIAFSGAEFEERYDHETGLLNYSYNINLDQRNFSPEHFPSLYKLYERWVELSERSWLIER
ncbi:MAG: DUF3857 domain-containing protein [Bacteroidota bacterium]